MMHIYDFDQLAVSGELIRTHAVLSIGVYDGLHIGHQRIIGSAVELARNSDGWKTVVITFAQNPKTMIGRNPFDKPLMSLRQSTDFFADLGVDYLVVIDFSPDFSKLTGEEFIARCCGMFDVQAVVVGENFRCGSHADTGVAELREIVPRHTKGAQVCVPDMYTLNDGTEDSSTLVRITLTKGKVSEIPAQLGRNYSVDLAHIPSRNNEYPLRFPIGSFVQLLPPPGVYETVLVMADRSERTMIALVDEEFLTLTNIMNPAPSVVHGGAGVSGRYDNLQFLKELTQIC
ncbi:MAG: FAD synthetase family protein [Sphaerochaetaceae bacterium]|jgi:riboflavin kinase/FMN adenylyltransferase|nr:FAD synthetase family protein [Sphaerochaetaceae bacterium]MDD3942308.1 FAD synthetase family protein [Sphaerochaetaceae bacterium]MDX9939982.1 FAD synthetase family protein [Sphaerochaetaceae bacterium]